MIGEALVPAGEVRAEIVVDKSRFIAAAAPAFSVEEARAYIQKIKAEYPDASHHVPVFLIGRGSGVTAHCSDDGEPSGTAGRPALAVLQGSGLGDVVVVVTRYFGGIKLGTGGLVRAYGDAVREVLKGMPKAEKVLTHQVMFSIPYSFLERVRLMVQRYKGMLENEEFGADIVITARFRDEFLGEFIKELSELSRGQIDAIIVESNPNTLMPI